MRAARLGRDYLLDCLGLARFRIDFAARQIAVSPAPDCAASTLVHLLLDQVLPRAVCHEGRVVLHASAVALRDGRVMAFTGPSGRGKSTLAFAMQRDGHRVLTDDCVLLEPEASGARAIPAYPSLRLWPDSAAALSAVAGSEVEGFGPMAQYTVKSQLKLRPSAGADAEQPHVLSALFLLEDPGRAETDRVDIAPVSGSVAIMTLIEAMFALDVVDRASIRRGFESIQRLADRIPTYRLAYRRDYAELPRVIQRITDLNQETYENLDVGLSHSTQ